MMRVRTWGRRVNRTVLWLLAAWLLAWLAAPGLAEQEPPHGPETKDDDAPDEAVAVEQGAAGATGGGDRPGGDSAEPGRKGRQAAAARQGPKAEPSSGQPGRVAVITVASHIFAGEAEFITDSIERAESGGFECLLIELDTPGGGLEETWKLVKRMLGAKVVLVVYVSPRGAHAASAGTFITYAAHVAAVAPSTRLGSAHPVGLTIPLPQQDESAEERKKRKDSEIAMLEKVTNDTVALMRSVAKDRGRNEEWAEKAVRESVSATADEAVEQNIVDLKASSVEELLEMIDGRQIKLDKTDVRVLRTRGAALVRWKMTLKQRLFAFLASPNILVLLLLIGLGGVAMEFYHPGAIFPGAVGALCLLLAAISSQLLPTNWGGFILILVGIGLMIAEVYVTSYGLLAIAGGVLLFVGGVLLIDPSSQPHFVDPSLRVDPSVLISVIVMLGALLLVVGYFVVRTQRRKTRTGAEGMVGKVGQVRSDVGPDGGKVFVHGEYWNAVSDAPIEAGARVEVLEMDGMLLRVKRRE